MGLVNKIKNISSKTWIKITLAAIFLMMLVLNFLTPMIADDYTYAINVNGHRLTGIMDIINFQINHYFTWGGRTIAHTIAQLFLLLPKAVFSVCNSIIYTAIIYLIYRLSKGKEKKDKPLFILAIHFMIYFLTPAFGQNCLWLIGSCNYIWTTFFILLLIFNFVLKGDKKDTILRIICMAILGVVAGWTNENTAFGLIVILAGTLIINKINKEKLPKWKISGLIGSIIGFITMIGAPGNYVRTLYYPDNDFILIKWLRRFINCSVGLKDHCLLFVIMLIILLTIYVYNRKKIDKFVYVFALGAILTVYPMVLSPEFPDRSWFGVVVFFTISVIMLAYNAENMQRIFKFIIIDLMIIISFIYAIDYVVLARDINTLRETWHDRERIIMNSDGSELIALTPYSTNNIKNPAFGLYDIVHGKDRWPNIDIARYYNKGEIIVDYIDENEQ